jgi:hypothetical protein
MNDVANVVGLAAAAFPIVFLAALPVVLWPFRDKINFRSSVGLELSISLSPDGTGKR